MRLCLSLEASFLMQQRSFLEQHDFSSRVFDLWWKEFVTLQTAPPPEHFPVDTTKLLRSFDWGLLLYLFDDCNLAKEVCEGRDCFLCNILGFSLIKFDALICTWGVYTIGVWCWESYPYLLGFWGRFVWLFFLDTFLLLSPETAGPGVKFEVTPFFLLL